jgi:K+-transporting ATPase ATPase A chain
VPPLAAVLQILVLAAGGGRDVGRAHPFENPNAFTNLFEIFLLLVIPFAMAWAFGLMVKDRRQGGAVLATMVVLAAAAVSLLTWVEMSTAGRAIRLAGAAMEGKETRFGEAAGALFGAATTLTSTGAVDSMHDSLTPQGGGIAMFDMMLGEIAPGGVGSGLYGLLMLAVVTVFLCGLMVGRTPEYLGKKIGQREIVLVASYILTTPVLVLLGALLLFGRVLPIVFVLALAGRFAAAKAQPASAGTLPTHRPLFVALLTGVALVVVGLTYVPALALGPIAESLS